MQGKTAVVATMHGKERVIIPTLAPLGLAFLPRPPIDTDRFGTFTRDIRRAGSQKEALAAKARAGLAAAPEADYAVASEGALARPAKSHPQHRFRRPQSSCSGFLYCPGTDRDRRCRYQRWLTQMLHFAALSIRDAEMSGGATHWHRMIARGSRKEQPHLRSVRRRPGATGDVDDALAPGAILQSGSYRRVRVAKRRCKNRDPTRRSAILHPPEKCAAGRITGFP